MRIIGRGRYAGETYPLRAEGGGGSAVVKIGYDQPIFDNAFLVDNTVIPRDATPNPLQVRLLGVTPGNLLEVDCTVGLENTDLIDAAAVATVAVVNFDAAPAPFGPGVGWYGIVASSMTQYILSSGPASINTAQLRNFAAVLIPPSAVNATVQIFCTTTVPIVRIYGTAAGSPGLGTTLKVSELDARFVGQVPPTVLEPA